MEDNSRGCFGQCHSVNDFLTNRDLKSFLLNSCHQGVWKVIAPGPKLDSSYPEDPDFETKRLEVLKSYNVLDQDTDASFERVTALAARLFDVPICLVSIVDLGRQWFASNRGLGETKETERNIAFCAHVILSKEDMMVVPDATKDDRFKNNPLVTDGPKIRFYAGVPLVTPEGFKLGTLCIIDTKPWPNGLNMSQKQNLLEMSALVMDTIIMRKKDREFKDKRRDRSIASAAHEMLTPLTTMQLNIGLLKEDKHLNASNETREILQSTCDCVTLLTTICNQTIDTFRSSHQSTGFHTKKENMSEEVVVSDTLDKVKRFITPHLEKVPVHFSVAHDVPPVIISSSMHFSGALMNMLVDTIESVKSGSINVSISVEHSESNEELLVNISRLSAADIVRDDDSDKEDVDKKFRFQSASKHIEVLGGHYGSRLCKPSGHKSEVSGSDGNKYIQWFTIPLSLPTPEKQNNNAHEKEKIEDLVLSSCSDDTNRQLKRNGCSSNLEEKKDFFKKVRLNSTPNVTEQQSEDESDSSFASNFNNNMSRLERQKCALIIDDTKIIRKVFERALSNLGFTVKQADNGLKGLLEMKTTMFDVVFCDFLMPVMDGLDCVKQYRAWEKEKRSKFQQYIVGISAHASPDDAQRGLDSGMNMYLQKPILLKQLQDIIKSDHISNNMKILDKLCRKSELRPYCLFSNDAEVASLDDSSLCTTSEAETSRYHFTCLIAEGSSELVTTMSRCIKRKGWVTRVVRNGHDTLKLMKMRNWDAIFIDDNLPMLAGNVCVSIFRKWESENRIALQQNIYLVSSSFNNRENNIVPQGYDGVIGTMISHDKIDSVLHAAELVRKKPSPV